MTKKKESFVLYYEWERAFQRLSDAQKGQLIQAIFDYEIRGDAYRGEDEAIATAMIFIEPAMDRNNEQYRAVCERNRKNAEQHHRLAKKRRSAVASGAEEEPAGTGEDQRKPVETRGAQRSTAGTSGLDYDYDPEPESEPDYDRERDRAPVCGGEPRAGRAREADAPASGAPTLGEIEQFVGETGLRVNARAFFDYYSARGWMLDGVRVRDWRALLRTWERREGQFQRPAARGSGTRAPIAPVPGKGSRRSELTEAEAAAESARHAEEIARLIAEEYGPEAFDGTDPLCATP